MRILVTGATGYIGGRLIPLLLESGHTIRVMVREASRIAGRPWLEDVEVAVGDVLDRDSLVRALEGVDEAFYLIHSMMTAGFETLDRTGAENFASAAPSTLRKVIYLGGLLPRGEQRSKHLRSRAEVGSTLASTLPVLELRAGPIIGSGSASFEMVRYLTERLPAMVEPRWIDNEVQPIAIDDVLRYLLRAVDRDDTGIIEIGSDRLTFRQMMQTYASIRGLRRFIVPVPVLAPRVSYRPHAFTLGWTGALERLQAAADEAGIGRALIHSRRGRVQTIPLEGGPAFVQSFYEWPPDGPPRLAGVVALREGRATVARTVAEALGEPAQPAPRALPADVLRARAAALYDAMEVARRAGDWRAYGEAWAALGRLLGRP